MDATELKARVKADGITTILAQWVDINGTPRCKAVPASAIDQFLAGSAGFAGGATVGMGQGPHSHDMIGMPDPASYTVVPWEKGVARVACDIHVDGAPYAYCPRVVLKRAIDCLEERGYTLKAGVEAEHMIIRRGPDGSIAPYDPSGFDTMAKVCYDFKSLSGSLGYLRALLGYMEQLGWEPYAADHEDGRAQFELNWKYSDALTTADRYTFFKMMTSQVAAGLGPGVYATHMPKPFANLTGSGSHVHFSLWDRRGRNVFLDEKDPRGLGQSKLAYQFLAGVMAHARGLSAVIAPTVNCYKRLSVGEYLTGAVSGFTWTPAFISYGGNNRTHMFRTPEPGRFEWRAVSGGVNLYLALAAMIHAGLDGIDRKLDPGEPLADRNMYELPLADVRKRKIQFIPQSLQEALDEFEKDEVVKTALGPELAAEFVHAKRKEWVRYHNHVSQWEIEQYLTLF